MGFYQLDTATAYDFGSSIVLPEAYCQKAKRLGYEGIGIADRNLYAYPSFQDAATKNGLKALFGCRVSLQSLLDRPLSAVLYVKDEEGYRNLLKLLVHKGEAIGADFLASLRQGLVLVLDSDDPAFKDPDGLTRLSPQLLLYKKTFQDDLYVGVSIASIVDQNEMPLLYEYCERNEYRTVAFPKVHYLSKADAASLYLLQKALRKEKAETIPESGPDFLLSQKAVESLYRQEDIERTEEIADKLTFSFFQRRGKLLHFDRDGEKLTALAYKGLTERLKTAVIPDSYGKRLEYELSVIKKMDFSSYFLLVSDYVQYAKSKGIKVGPGRGSASGSLVSYALYITDLDPIRYNLSFERFLNPKRKDMPDIDVDFEDDRRNEVVDYLKVRYGEKRVSDIVTFVKLKPRSAINLVGPALSYPENRLKKLTSTIRDSAKSIEEALQDNVLGYRLRKLLSDSYYQDLARKVEPLLGVPVNTSVHAAGVILSEEEIYETCPVKDGTHGTVLYEYPYMERMGFLKVDILSLSNLTFIRKVEESVSTKVDIQAHLDDKKTFACLNNLDLALIFQLESTGMQKTIQQVRPSTFEDIASILALYRPGPKDYIPEFALRKQGRKEIVYADPRLEPILKETYGIIVYQEQVIAIVQALASFSASEADLFRRAISKKKIQEMERYKEKFLKGCAANGIEPEKAESIYQDIEKFASYGFNKSHAYAYALLSYTLLYLKANEPEAFYKVALKETSVGSDGNYKILQEIYRRGFVLRGPDVNNSSLDQVAFKGKAFYLPLTSVAFADKNLLSDIEAERKNGPFRSFYDFCKKLEGKITLNAEKTVASLIDAGALDSLSPSRAKMKELLHDYLSFIHMNFPEDQLPALDGEESLGKRLFLEKKALGVILSRSLKSVVRKDGFKTMLVLDDSAAEKDGFVLVTDGRKDYRLHVRKADMEDYDFLLVKADIDGPTIYDGTYTNMKGRIERYGKDNRR